MIIHELGNPENPKIMLIHGGGNAWWNYLRQGRALAEQYHVLLPTMDGHGEEWQKPYVSTEATAEQLVSYIKECCGGLIFALAGVSLGGQVVIEILSREPDICKKAIIDGSICHPQSLMAHICSLTIRLCYKFIFSPKAAQKQLDLMRKKLPSQMQFPEEIQEYYLRDMPQLPKATMLTIYKTYMASYSLKDSLKSSLAQTTYWYGEKEMGCVKKSANLFQRYLPDCRLYEAKGYNHGYLAIYLPDEWLQLANAFFSEP